MAHHLSRFAAATITERWPARLGEIGARVWWTCDTDPVAARAAQRSTGLDAVVPASLGVVALLADLPQLECIDTANCCRTVWSSGLGFVTVIGFEPDLAATETIFTSLLVQATAAMAGEGRRVARSGPSRTRAFRRSFLTAYAYRIGARLREVTDAETASATDQVSP